MASAVCNMLTTATFDEDPGGDLYVRLDSLRDKRGGADRSKRIGFAVAFHALPVVG